MLAFGAFAGAAALYAAYVWRELCSGCCTCRRCRRCSSSSAVANALGGAVVASGIAGVFCSVMLYVKTAREYWSASRTLFRFFATAALLGMATTLVSLATFGGDSAGDARGDGRRRQVAGGGDRREAGSGSWSIFVHLGDKQLGSLKRTALLLKGELAREAGARLLLRPGRRRGAPASCWRSFACTAAARRRLSPWRCSASSPPSAELLERKLFFRAASPPRMPGAVL